MTPLERAARALYERGQDYRSPMTTLGDPLPWEDLTTASRARYFAGAHVVLQAIREPSEAMIYAHSEGGLGFNDQVISDWQAMIDAALEEGPVNGA